MNRFKLHEIVSDVSVRGFPGFIHQEIFFFFRDLGVNRPTKSGNGWHEMLKYSSKKKDLPKDILLDGSFLLDVSYASGLNYMALLLSNYSIDVDSGAILRGSVSMRRG